MISPTERTALHDLLSSAWSALADEGLVPYVDLYLSSEMATYTAPPGAQLVVRSRTLPFLDAPAASVPEVLLAARWMASLLELRP